MILEPITYRELPDSIRSSYVSDKGGFRVEIIPSINIYNIEKAQALVSDIKERTGHYPVGIPILMNDISMLVQRDIGRIIVLCFIIIALVSMLAFKSIKLGILTISPLIATFVFTFGLIPLLNIEINLFSIAGFPLILGIGIDGSIHLMQRLLEIDDTPLINRVTETGRAIILTALTTMIGFGSLATINHPGMRNFGLIVVVGIGLNLIFTMIIIPIGMRKRHIT